MKKMKNILWNSQTILIIKKTIYWKLPEKIKEKLQNSSKTKKNWCSKLEGNK
jgi:hypothetical protein